MSAGKVVKKIGDDVSTDIIYPGRFMATVLPTETPQFAFADDTAFNQMLIRRQIPEGSIILAGKNFGCGSSREQAASALKGHPVRVVAKSAARIFLQNAINLGLCVVVCPEIDAEEGDELELTETAVINLRTGAEYAIVPLTETQKAVMEAGGLINYTRSCLTGETQLFLRRKYRIAWLPGDGIGPEVCDAARKVLEAVVFPAEYIHGDIGWELCKAEGEAFPERTLKMMRETDCALFGAITSKPKREAEEELTEALRGRVFSYRSPIVRMRQLLDLFICFRPCKAYAGNQLNFREGMDIAVFRENTEGMYVGVEYERVPEAFYTVSGMEKIPQTAAISLRSITASGSERIVRAAFLYAQRHGRKKVTAVHKANVLRATDGVFLEAARKVAREFPEIALEEANVDAMCMWLLKDPNKYD